MFECTRHNSKYLRLSADPPRRSKHDYFKYLSDYPRGKGKGKEDFFSLSYSIHVGQMNRENGFQRETLA